MTDCLRNWFQIVCNTVPRRFSTMSSPPRNVRGPSDHPFNPRTKHRARRAEFQHDARMSGLNVDDPGQFDNRSITVSDVRDRPPCSRVNRRRSRDIYNRQQDGFDDSSMPLTAEPDLSKDLGGSQYTGSSMASVPGRSGPASIRSTVSDFQGNGSPGQRSVRSYREPPSDTEAGEHTKSLRDAFLGINLSESPRSSDESLEPRGNVIESPERLLGSVMSGTSSTGSRIDKQGLVATSAPRNAHVSPSDEIGTPRAILVPAKRRLPNSLLATRMATDEEPSTPRPDQQHARRFRGGD